MPNYDQAIHKTNALRHTAEMQQMYAEEIKKSIKNTCCYGPDHVFSASASVSKPEFIFENKDSVTAAKDWAQNPANGKTALLNFASYKFPGGGFIEGKMAQEEAVCYGSFLYNVLKTFDSNYYLWNRQNLNGGLYLNRALYSPDIIFHLWKDQDGNKEFTACDVITCASPNLRNEQYGHFTRNENDKTLQERMDFIKNIAEENGDETLILGAWGCGVFKQDPKFVAECIQKSFALTSVKRIVLAVPGRDRNAEVFRRVFSDK